jgi:hypothetical protein
VTVFPEDDFEHDYGSFGTGRDIPITDEHGPRIGLTRARARSLPFRGACLLEAMRGPCRRVESEFLFSIGPLAFARGLGESVRPNDR